MDSSLTAIKTLVNGAATQAERKHAARTIIREAVSSPGRMEAIVEGLVRIADENRRPQRDEEANDSWAANVHLVLRICVRVATKAAAQNAIPPTGLLLALEDITRPCTRRLAAKNAEGILSLNPYLAIAVPEDVAVNALSAHLNAQADLGPATLRAMAHTGTAAAAGATAALSRINDLSAEGGSLGLALSQRIEGVLDAVGKGWDELLKSPDASAARQRLRSYIAQQRTLGGLAPAA